MFASLYAIALCSVSWAFVIDRAIHHPNHHHHHQGGATAAGQIDNSRNIVKLPGRYVVWFVCLAVRVQQQLTHIHSFGGTVARTPHNNKCSQAFGRLQCMVQVRWSSDNKYHSSSIEPQSLRTSGWGIHNDDKEKACLSLNKSAALRVACFLSSSSSSSLHTTHPPPLAILTAVLPPVTCPSIAP
jgi:hypothetical protein